VIEMAGILVGVDGSLKAAAGADLVVVGSRGTGGVSKLLLGPVSLQVMRHARCPVAVIPAEST
jgi:nucleotide-binding universal stress UspA family protein